MVKAKLHKHALIPSIAEAISAAEKATTAEIILVIAPASDAYQSYLLLYGLMIGSFAALVLWSAKLVTNFSLLLLVQWLIVTSVTLVPWLQSFCMRLIPRRILRHRGAHRAAEEYLMASRHLPASTPIIVFYVSTAERYAHIIASRLVREKVGNEQWDAIMTNYTARVRPDGFEKATCDAVRVMTALLIPYFPEN